MKTTFLISIILSMAMTAAFSQEKTGKENRKETKSEKKERTEMLINSRNFVFHARRALPSGGNSVDLTTNRSYVIFQPDFIESYMAFFGRAYSGVGYGTDTGLHFNGKPDEYKVEMKKNNYQVTATVRSGNDSFRIFLTVASEGSATMSISSNNRESISYLGEIVPPEKKEKGE